ncbi:MarR family winged helix-turn-helix transcriptional regulator [Loigolactobacillus zhaoyuanensis]|uniref:MarR family winged helix-turn-helix transcriptional regulator n=1 Tax=Loigolactobacillus zhaoyuanensis TaxID=2486017 RepID=A0ABW8UHQ1_9LACO|nr:MarR family transcriptional regulator [Loigolactobacillus zhaoyuanensis]
MEQLRQHYTQQIGQQLNLNRADVRLLSYLIESEQTLVELRHATGLDVSTLSRQLTALTHKKMLQKQREQQDKRKLKFTLTALGRTQFTRFRQASATLEQSILANWPTEEQQLLKVLLNRLLTSAQRLNLADN